MLPGSPVTSRRSNLSVTVEVCIQTEVSPEEVAASLASALGDELLRLPCKIDDGFEFWTVKNVALFVCDNDLMNDRNLDFESYNRLVMIRAYRNDPEERRDMCLDVGRAAFLHLVARYNASTLMTFDAQRLLDRHVPRNPAGAVKGRGAQT
jgi:hypothetical protein